MAEQRVVPMFSYEDVGRAADWIAKAFGFEEKGRWSDESGRVTHVNMELDGGMIMLGYPSADYQSPKHHAEVCDQARTWRQAPYVVDGLYVTVDDVDAHYARAQAAGRDDPVGARAQHGNRTAPVPSRGSRRPSLDVRAAALARRTRARHGYASLELLREHPAMAFEILGSVLALSDSRVVLELRQDRRAPLPVHARNARRRRRP